MTPDTPYPRYRVFLLQFNSFTVGFHQALFFPIIAANVTEDLRQNASMVGTAFFIFMVTAVLGALAMPVLVTCTVPRNLFIATYVTRALAGVMYALVPGTVSQYGTTAGTFLYMTTRAVHGTSTLSSILSVASGASRMRGEQRQAFVSSQPIYQTFGMLIGPQVGTLIAALTTPDSLAALWYTAWTLSVSSILLCLVTMWFFDDHEPFTREPPPKSVPPEHKKLIALYAISQGFVFAGVVAIEALLGLITDHMYGMGPAEAWPFWLVLSLATPVGIIFYKLFYSRLGGDLPTSRVLYVTASVGGLMIINWVDVTHAVSSWQLWVGLLITSAGTMGTMGLLNSASFSHLPVNMMAILSSVGGIMAMAGRAFGPVVTTSVYQAVRRRSPDTMLADNVGLFVQFAYVLASILIGLIWGNEMFGTPPKEAAHSLV